MRYSQLQSLGGLLTQSPAQLTAYQYHSKLPTSTEWSTGIQMLIPWSTSVDVAYVGHHNYNAELTGQLNAVDIGTAFDPNKQDPTSAPSATPGASSLAALFPDLVRGYTGLHRDRLSRSTTAGASYHAIQFSINRRFKNGIAFGFNDAITLQDIAKIAPRYDHDASRPAGAPRRPGAAQELLQDQLDPTALHEGHRALAAAHHESARAARSACWPWIVNDWQLSGVWTAATGTPYAATFSYQNGGGNVNLTGSPDFGAPHPDRRRSGRRVQQQPVRAVHRHARSRARWWAARGWSRPTTIWWDASPSALDLSLQREIPLGGSRTSAAARRCIQRAESGVASPGRITSMTLNNPNDPVTIVNNQFNADGTVNQTRVKPQNAGFGGVNAWQNPRTVQGYIRFKF